MAQKKKSETHKEVSVAEFFEKNRHLLGFNNPQKSLLTSVKEAVDNSVTYDTPITVSEKGELRIRKIGEFIDEKMDCVEESRGGALHRRRIQDTKVLCFDRESFKLKFKEMSTLFRHKVNSKILRVTLSGGKHIDLTDYHSVFVFKDNKIKSVKTSELDINDRVVVPNAVWNPTTIFEIDLLEEVLKLPESETGSIGVYGIRDILPKIKEALLQLLPDNRRYRISDFKKCDRIPLNIVRKLDASLFKDCTLDFMFGTSRIPTKLPITKELAEFLGLYAAEGSISGGYKVNLSFGTHEVEILKYTSRLFTTLFGIRVSELAAHKTAINLTVNSRMLAFLLKKVFIVGASARTKQIPRFVFNFTPKLRERFLLAYSVGDGYPSNKIFSCFENCGSVSEIKAERIILATASKDLANGLLYLTSSLGKDCTIEEKPAKDRVIKGTKAKFGKSYILYIYTSQKISQINRLPFDGVVESTTNSKLVYNLSNKKQTQVLVQNAVLLEQSGQLQFTEIGRKLIMGDLGLLRIKRIEKIDYDRDWVYDVSVPGEENFAAGFGPIMCHNSLDAAEDAEILPEIYVKLKKIRDDRYMMIVEDNGPGIIKRHLTKAFGKLLYGSKFQTIGGKQARGQQGIGISAVILYSQLTTGKPAKLISKTKKDKKAHVYNMHIDVKKNEPEIINSEEIDWDRAHGVRIEVEMEAKYIETKQSVPEYIKETAVVNPHAKITYVDPNGQKLEFPRVSEKLPEPSKPIRPHPHGIELGILKRMIKDTKARTIKSFLTKEFDKVGGGTANEMLKKAELDPQILPRLLEPEQQEALLIGMQDAKVMKPSLDCLSPIGADLLKKSIRSEFDVDFVHTITRSPTVYLGRPFQMEIGIAYGGELEQEGPIKLIRFANKVPLLYQEGACAITKAVKKMSWKPYGLQQSSGNMPVGPAIIVVHMASVWVPFTSEGKEAISDFPEIAKEIKLALQECARNLQRYVRRRERADIEAKKRETFKAYSLEVAQAILNLTTDDSHKLSKKDVESKSAKMHKQLLKLAEQMYLTEKEVEELEAKEAEEEAEEEEELAEERKEEKEEFKEDEE